MRRICTLVSTLAVTIGLCSCRSPVKTNEMVSFDDLQSFEAEIPELLDEPRSASGRLAGGGSEPEDSRPNASERPPVETNEHVQAGRFERISTASLIAEVERRLAESGAPQPAARILEQFALQSAAHSDSFDRGAITALLQDESTIESKLMAAALLGKAGSHEDRNALLVEAYHAVNEELDAVDSKPTFGGTATTRSQDAAFGQPAPGTTPTEQSTDAASDPATPLDDESDLEIVATEFGIPHLAFASKIRGLDDYTPRESDTFEAGSSLLIYGEFAGFEESLQSTPSSAPVFQRNILAYLEILNDRGKLVKSEIIVDGSHSSELTQSRINFWARTVVPYDSPGEHTLRIRAKDREQKVEVIQELKLLIVPARIRAE